MMGTKVVVSFALDAERDRRILRWLNAQPNRSAAIRTALEAHLGGGGVTLGDVYRAIRDLEHRLDQGVVMAQGGPVEGQHDDDPELAQALANIADLGL